MESGGMVEDEKLRVRERRKIKRGRQKGRRYKMGQGRGLEQEPGYTDAYCLLWFPVLTL